MWERGTVRLIVEPERAEFDRVLRAGHYLENGVLVGH